MRLERFNALNFELVEYTDTKGEKRPMYILTKDGFMILALGYSNPSRSVQDHCKHAELFRTTNTVGLNINPRGELVVPESDVYRLIMRSNLPNAERFQDWVVEEVLPSIR